MLTQLLNESAPSEAQAQGAVAFSRLGDGKPHNKTAAGTAGAPLEVLFCQEGSLEVEAPGRRAQAKKGTVLLFSAVPGSWSVCANAEFRGAVLTLKRAGLLAFGRKFGGFALNENSAHRLEASGGCALLQACPWEVSVFASLEVLPAEEQADYLKLKTAELLYLLGREALRLCAPAACAYYDSHQREAVRQAHDDMLARLNEPITIAQLADRHHLSQTLLKTCFRQVYGRSIHAFLREQRLRKAAQLLETTGLPVLQVAADVGYGSVSQFGQAFRRQYGVSPAQYRRING